MALIALQSQAHFIDYLPAGTGGREYYVDYARDVRLGSAFDHRFCGPHDVAGSQCPNCDRPLLRFLALDTRDSRLGLGQVPFSTLPLFYCWRCPVSQEMFSYRVLDDGAIGLLVYGRGAPEDDWPYSEYPKFFPEAPARLVEVTEEVQDIYKHLNATGEFEEWGLTERNPELLLPRHQYGGEPLHMQQDPEYCVRCPDCAEPMPFTASIGADCLDERGLVTSEAVQVIYHYCPACRVVSAFQQTD
jgi:hypothetical protein